MHGSVRFWVGLSEDNELAWIVGWGVVLCSALGWQDNESVIQLD